MQWIKLETNVRPTKSLLVLSYALSILSGQNNLKIAISSFGKSMKLEEIQKILANHKKELYEKYKIKEIGIFGSFVIRKELKSKILKEVVYV